MFIQFVEPNHRDLWFNFEDGFGFQGYAVGVCFLSNGKRRPKILIAKGWGLGKTIRILCHELLHCPNWNWLNKWLDNL